VSFLPSHCLAHHLPTHHLAPFLQVQKMIFFSINPFFGLASSQDQKLDSLKRKKQRKSFFYKKNPFLVLWIGLITILDTLDMETTWQ
jgi:hypothetical protein